MTRASVSTGGNDNFVQLLRSSRGSSELKGEGVDNEAGVVDSEGPMDRLVNGDREGEKGFELGAALKLKKGPELS